MTHVPRRFPHNDIMSLTSHPVRFDLAESLGPDLRLGELLADLRGDELRDLALAYGPTEGRAELRELIAARQGVTADDVVTTAGGMQALFLIAFVLSEPGAEVVIGQPAFPNARTVLQSVGMSIADLPVRFDDGYRLDADRLRAVLTPRTRLVSLASPQNPSGVVLTDREMHDLLATMDAICPGAFLLVDETYREAVYGEAEVRPSLVGRDRRLVSCASFSKCHGAPGIRTGWLITQHQALRTQLILGKFNTTISNSVVDEALALRILQRGETIMRGRRRHLASGLQRTAAFVAAHADLIEWVRPDAGALCCVRLKRGVFSEADVSRFHDELAVRETRVAPGSWFGDEVHVVRLGFGLLGAPDLDEALGRLSEALKSVARSKQMTAD
ncbi:putative aminotransferase [Bradyrhizobium sp. ORS 285]|uniref:pyridoxal phosphate-dependent aminotransferase n=1 Tax=Bradyrhizobium sp. ORS 285 TaxID=115808 RepID=UPI000240627F|nr:pyridoxal phosphate-dependent aminotransferase [Bradyrhizobium sp. ORS 285]CCD89497.1 putative aminotransferase [Bradyrhizobium sp. ORS 285]SMX58745.1 putative aminotransferase [Bradyrhizobium sp. ORS 285]